jgi:hypothetical protein
VRLRVHLALIAIQRLFVTLAMAGRHVLQAFPAGGQRREVALEAVRE